MRANDPYLSFNFRVELAGIEIGAFSEVSGLQVELETHDYREGGLNEYKHKLAGPVHYPSNLTFKRGLVSVDILWAWQQTLVSGEIVRVNGSIILMDSAAKDRWRWNFKDGYPVKWAGPDLRGVANEVAVESLELSHRGLSMQPV